MNIFNYFKRKADKQSNNSFIVSSIVQQMFDEAGISPVREEDMFMTEIDGTNTRFTTVLMCDRNKTNKLLIYTPFILPVPPHIKNVVDLELNRINSLSNGTSEVLMKESDNGGFEIFAFTQCEFDKAPTTFEIKELMVHNVDILDDSNFKSLACTMFGCATYNEVQSLLINNASEAVTSNATTTETNVEFKFEDGYCSLNNNAGNISSPRYYGRLLMLCVHVDKRPETQNKVMALIKQQAPFADVIYEAYRIASPEERDIMRKLRYLIDFKKTDTKDEDFEGESMLGRIEASGMIINGIETLLK